MATSKISDVDKVKIEKNQTFEEKMTAIRFYGCTILLILIFLLLCDLFLVNWVVDKFGYYFVEEFGFLPGWLDAFFLVILTALLLALIFVRFTIVKEGTSKLVVRLGRYKKTLLTKRGYEVDGDGEIVPIGSGRPSKFPLPGGMAYVGIWPLDSVYVQDEFEWIKVNADNTAEDRREQNVDFILAKDYVYGIRISKAEDEGLVPLDVLLSVTAWVSNPSKAYVRNVKDWFRTLVGRISHYPREFIAEKSYEKIQKADLENEIMQKLVAEGIIREFKERYGITIHKIEVLDINPDERFRELTIQKRVGQLNADQAVEETAGRVLKMVAAISGLEPEVLKSKLAADHTLRGKAAADGGFKEAFDYAKDQVKRDRAGEQGELTDIRVGNSDGTPFPEGAIIGGLAAIFGQKNKGGGGGGNPSRKKNKKNGGPKPVKDDGKGKVKTPEEEYPQEDESDDD